MSNENPVVSREDEYLNAILNNSGTANLPAPISREDKYLYDLVGKMQTKADLVGGKVPTSQLPSYVSTVVEVNTYADLPAVGASSTIYVVKNENNQQYRWGGTTYIPVGDEKVYYAVTVVTMTTMGELKAYVDGINSQQLHILLDMHNYVNDAYACTAHFYQVGNVKHCEIFDLLNSQYIQNPAGFVDSDTIASFCTNKRDIALAPKVKTTLDATATLNTIYSLSTQSAITTALPAGTTVGDVISIIWYNGATPATVTITGTMIPFSYTPTANTRSEINAMWDGTNWCLVSNEQAVTASE